MKKALPLLGCLVLLAQLLHGQITLTSGDMPTSTTIIQTSPLDSASLANLNIGNGGSNQTWNFGSLTVDPYSDFTYYYNSAQTPYASSFLGATLASTYEISDTAEYSYYKLNTTELSIMGSEDPTYMANYTPPFRVFNFPFTYQGSFNQSSTVSGSSDGISISGTYTTSVQADGYGNVTTVLGTFPCLRVKRINELNITVFIFNVIQRETTWEWWTKQFDAPVLTYDRYFTSAFGQDDSGETASLLTAQTVSDKQPVPTAENVNLTIAPNPSGDRSTLTFKLTNTGKTDITVVNTEGKVVRQGQLDNPIPGWQTYDLDLSDAGSGTYYVMLRQRGKVLSIKPLVKN